jgi:hypothetical protein
MDCCITEALRFGSLFCSRPQVPTFMSLTGYGSGFSWPEISSGHTMKVYWGSSDTALLFLSLGVTWIGAVNATPRPLYLRKKVPGIQWTGGWVGPTAGVRTSNRPARIPVKVVEDVCRGTVLRHATTCFSCSPPDLNSVVINFMYCVHVK